MIDSTSSRTRLSYTIQLQPFFHYLIETNPLLTNKKPNQIPYQVLGELKPEDIEEYLIWLTAYHYTNKYGKDVILTNTSAGKATKLCTLRSLYLYLVRHNYFSVNPTEIVRTPVVHEKNIIRLEPNEISIFLDTIERGSFPDGELKEVGTKTESRIEHTHNGSPLLSNREKKFHKVTMLRDLAIATLLLGTGIRVSECAGLNIQSVNFDNNCISVVRKGGDEDEVYFGEDVQNALSNYLENGRLLFPDYESTDALFLSLRGTRLTPRMIEIMIKKYSQRIVAGKKITPHKLRSTHGTALYEATGDILLVADKLGHKSVETTKQHYIAKNKEKQRATANAVKLR